MNEVLKQKEAEAEEARKDAWALARVIPMLAEESDSGKDWPTTLGKMDFA